MADDEKEAIQMLYRIISSLNEEQVEDLLTQFEKKIFNHAKGNLIHIKGYITLIESQNYIIKVNRKINIKY